MPNNKIISGPFRTGEGVTGGKHGRFTKQGRLTGKGAKGYVGQYTAGPKGKLPGMKEGLFNSYRNIANVLLEGDWNTRHFSPQERVDRAESDTQREAPFDKRGKKHVKLRQKRLALRSALARAALENSKKIDAMADNRDMADDMRTGGNRY